MPIALAVHGGAWNIPDESVQDSHDGVRAALEAGWIALQRGGDALAVVEQVIRILEDDPTFDAGRGSRLNRAGRVEMDASIMEGTGLEAGAVAAIQGVLHPISVARRLMAESQHVMLVGDGARDFADEIGAELCHTSDLLVGRERERWERVRAGERHLITQEFDADPPKPMGTVGCVALDAAGRISAGTSTGGTQDKAPGRVGDTPVIGAGCYADDFKGGASATGWGEGILRVVLCKTAIDCMAVGASPEHAGRDAIATLDRVRGKAGLILVDPRGRAAAVFNTPRMARGLATEADGPRVLVEPGGAPA